MSRRYHGSSNGEFDNQEYNTGPQQNAYDYYGNDSYSYSQGTYEYSANFNFDQTSHQSAVDNTYNMSQNGSSHYGHIGQNDQYSNMNSYNNIPQVNFPTIKPSPIVQQTEAVSSHTAKYSYGGNSEISWLAAFSSGGFENEPPLLEELGINFSHIKNKTLASINPFRKLDAGALNDADLTGPLLFCFLFGMSLLLTGKVHFGYIYGVATLGWISIFSILNLMTLNGVSFYLTASVLGYCLLPMVLLSALAVLLKLRGIIGLILGITSVSWCTFSSSTYFVAAFGMQNQQILIAYPIFLLYSCFALMTIF